MRTISALIAATFCALALSGPTWSADGKLDNSVTPSPGWLDVRTAVAAEDLWPRDAHAIKAGRAKPTIPAAKPDKFAAIEDAAVAMVAMGLDVLRGWGKAADRFVEGGHPTLLVAGK